MKIETIRHSFAHILASAVGELYPGTKFGIGPAIEQGFYYDFDFSEVIAKQTRNKKRETDAKQISKEDLPKIEEKMRELIKKNLKFEKSFVSKEKAKEIFKDQPYKLELIEELPEKEISIYKSGDFIDLCQGPHIKSTLQLHSGQALQFRSGQTKEIPEAFKLLKIAGAYWRGSERNPMLTRVYGVAFGTKKELENYLRKEAEAEKRDHRVLGQKLELFMFDEEMGAGLPVWLPKGAILKFIIENFLREELRKAGYHWLSTPHIANLKLWKTSGHWDFYRENMYSPIEIEKEKYLLKPMNCPFHVKVYNSKIRSYRDLPLRLAELGTVYRYERSGVLHGLVRVRGFTQDDAHIWCTAEQLSEELTRVLKFGLKILKTFGFQDYEIYLATKPEKYIGSEKIWQKATNSLKYALEKLKLSHETDLGGGVFYGPKVDIKIKDSLGRPWQCTTIQVDFNLPERFEMTYIDGKGKKQRPLMIHRALLGSLERFIGVLLEHYGGALPLWLSPEQIWIIPVGSRHKKYANFVNKQLTTNNLQLTTYNLRTKIKDENETVSKKIRDGELQKIPYMLVVGDEEMKSKSVRVRERGKGDIGPMKLNKFLDKVKMEIEKKK